MTVPVPQDSPLLRPFLRLTAGFLIWGAAFVLVYGFHATGCVLGWHSRVVAGGASLLQLLLWGLAALDLMLAALLAVVARRWAKDVEGGPDAALLPRAAQLATLGALLASVVNFGFVFLLAPC